jgi:hypothetical protein
MKTAIQMAIESYQNDGVSFTDWFIDNYKMLLEKEKEQIIESYEDGKQNGMESITNVNAYIIGEYYYNQTYNNETIN